MVAIGKETNLQSVPEGERSEIRASLDRARSQLDLVERLYRQAVWQRYLSALLAVTLMIVIGVTLALAVYSGADLEPVSRVFYVKEIAAFTVSIVCVAGSGAATALWAVTRARRQALIYSLEIQKLIRAMANVEDDRAKLERSRDG